MVVEAIVFVQVQVQGFCEQDGRTHGGFKLIVPENVAHPGNLQGFFGRQLMAIPAGDGFVGAFDEQHFTKHRVRAVGEQYQHRVFLINAAQVEEVAVLTEPEEGIGVARHFVVAVEQRDAAGFHAFTEFLAVAYEEVAWDVVVFHEF